jgi:hypothetical protein
MKNATLRWVAKTSKWRELVSGWLFQRRHLQTWDPKKRMEELRLTLCSAACTCKVRGEYGTVLEDFSAAHPAKPINAIKSYVLELLAGTLSGPSRPRNLILQGNIITEVIIIAV